MSPKNRYKIRYLVSSLPDLAKFQDNFLRGTGGLVRDKKTLWVANNGTIIGRVRSNVTHYKLNGFPLPERPFFVPIPGPFGISPPRDLLYDLLYLYRSVSILRTGQPIIVPVPNLTDFEPVIEPTLQAQLLSFLSGPNGYLTLGADVRRLLNFCVLVPNNPNAPPLDSALQAAFREAHKKYLELSLNVTSQTLINQFTRALLEVQRLLPPASLSNDNIVTSNEMIPTGNPLDKVIEEEIIVENVIPIGITRNKTQGFVVKSNLKFAAAKLIVVSNDGSIWAYNPLVNTNFLRVFNNNISLAHYTGVAIASTFLYVTDLLNQRVDVFNFNFEYQKNIQLIDPDIPIDYSPFNIVNIDDLLYVLYAKTGSPNFDTAEPGPGNGYISIFNPDGTFIKRLVSRGHLNAPWGLVVAPHQFKKFSGKLLVGNHGDGKINVYDRHGNHLGKLKDKDGKTIVVEGLWGLVNHKKSIYFSSVSSIDSNGLVGKIFHR